MLDKSSILRFVVGSRGFYFRQSGRFLKQEPPAQAAHNFAAARNDIEGKKLNLATYLNPLEAISTANNSFFTP